MPTSFPYTQPSNGFGRITFQVTPKDLERFPGLRTLKLGAIRADRPGYLHVLADSQSNKTTLPRVSFQTTRNYEIEGPNSSGTTVQYVNNPDGLAALYKFVLTSFSRVKPNKFFEIKSDILQGLETSPLKQDMPPLWQPGKGLKHSQFAPWRQKERG